MTKTRERKDKDKNWDRGKERDRLKKYQKGKASEVEEGRKKKG